MKITLICAGGMSTSILMKKLEKYASEHGEDAVIMAHGSMEGSSFEDADVILLGPQVSYQKDAIKKASGKPVGVMQPYDYAIGNCESIFKLAHSLVDGQ